MKKLIFNRVSYTLSLALCLAFTGNSQTESPTMYKGFSNTFGTMGSYYGSFCNATGHYAFGGGYDSDATGRYSLALGVRNRSTNYHAVTIGIDLQATGNRSMVIGSGALNGSDLVNNQASSLMVGFNSTVATFFVGGATSSSGTGFVGVGTSTPSTTFNVANTNGSGIDSHLEGFTLIDGDNASLLLGNTLGSPSGEWGIEAGANGLNFWQPFGNAAGVGTVNHRLHIANDGNVSIGTDDSKGYKFAVAGSMVAEEVTVKLQSNWPDFVFTSNYGLMSLTNVELFIAEHSHLPNVPSAVQIQEEGINLGEMDAILLQKIEELTLYLIELKKQNEQLVLDVNTLKNN